VRGKITARRVCLSISIKASIIYGNMHVMQIFLAIKDVEKHQCRELKGEYWGKAPEAFAFLPSFGNFRP
jgi:hypothetical protein